MEILAGHRAFPAENLADVRKVGLCGYVHIASGKNEPLMVPDGRLACVPQSLLALWPTLLWILAYFSFC